MIERQKRGDDPSSSESQFDRKDKSERPFKPVTIFWKKTVMLEKETINYFSLFDDGRLLIVRFNDFLKFYEVSEITNKYDVEVGSI